MSEKANNFRTARAESRVRDSNDLEYRLIRAAYATIYAVHVNRGEYEEAARILEDWEGDLEFDDTAEWILFEVLP